MGVPGSESSILGGAAGQSGAGSGFYPYQIENSIYMQAGTAQYLSRTFGTATSRDTFTISTWVKRHTEVGSSSKSVIFSGGTSGSQYTYTSFASTDGINIDAQTTAAGIGTSNEQFRDTSSWYHVVYRIDTSQSSQADRLRVYVNGTQLTGLDLSSISQDEDFAHWNAAEAFYIGQKNGIGHAADGTNLMYAETLFFDGQSYAPTEMAEEKQGIWIPKDPSALTFGYNGFHMKYANAGALGTDSSGNGNNFSVTNLSASNQMIDTPTTGAGG
jgi:hypothetical protein